MIQLKSLGDLFTFCPLSQEWMTASRGEAAGNKSNCMMICGLMKDRTFTYLNSFGSPAPPTIRGWFSQRPLMVGGAGDTIFILQVKITELRELRNLPKVAQLASGRDTSTAGFLTASTSFGSRYGARRTAGAWSRCWQINVDMGKESPKPLTKKM